MTRKVNFIYEEKQGSKYVETFRRYDEAVVYEELAHELISKKINGCTYIKSIKRTPLYDGFQKIIVTYDNGSRRIYTVKN